MTNYTTIIGILCETYDRTFLCSVAELCDALQDKHCHYTSQQYCDFRYSTNLQRFRYDPFTGSATTAIACIKEKRHFVGFELSKDYYDLACKRIQSEKSQLIFNF